MKSITLKVLPVLVPLLLIASCTSSGSETQTTTPAPATSYPVAPAMPAGHAGLTVCFICHQPGIYGAPKFPAGHEASADTLEFCSECHKAPPAVTKTPTTTATKPVPSTTSTPSSTSTQTAIPTSTTAPAVTTTTLATTTTTTTTTTAPSGTPAKMPANHAGRSTCLACHQSGIGGATKVPAVPNHGAFTDSLVFCQACHKGP